VKEKSLLPPVAGLDRHQCQEAIYIAALFE